VRPQRLTPRQLGDTVRSLTGPADKPVGLWIPNAARAMSVIDLVVHFHGAAWLPEQAVAGLARPTLAWGPRGMQQLSEVRAGRFELLGFCRQFGPGPYRPLARDAGAPRTAA
jgi:hypothetical protein